MPLANNFLTTLSASAFFASSAALASAFAFFASREGCHFFFGPLQSRLLFFQVSFQSVNVGGDGCDLSIQRHNGLLFLRDLGCVVVISFGTVFAAFRSGHRDNFFPFL